MGDSGGGAVRIWSLAQELLFCGEGKKINQETIMVIKRPADLDQQHEQRATVHACDVWFLDRLVNDFAGTF